MDKKEILDRFISLYTGLKRAHGIYRLGSTAANGKVGGKAQTVNEELTRQKYINHLSGKTPIGVVPIREDSTCSFGVIDIDEYNGATNHAVLERETKRLKLPLVICRSKSGGAHCYLFLTEPIPAGDMLDTMSMIAVELGYPGVEIFPKQRNLASDKDVGNWINIPYCDSELTNRYAIIDEEPAELEQFIEHAWEKRLTPEDFYKINIIPEVNDMLQGAPPCLVALAQQTVGEGGRNNAMYNFAVYCKQRWPDSWEAKANEFNAQYINPALTNKEVIDVVKSINRKDYFYSCNTPPIQQFCNKTICKKAEFGVGGATLTLMAPVFPENIQKIMTEPPIWIIGVEGDRLECNTDQLMNQTLYQKMILERLNKVHGVAKQPIWLKKIGELMESVEIIAAPEEITNNGQLAYYVEDFLINRPRARERADVTKSMVWVEEGLVHFVGNKFIEYLSQHRISLSGSEVWAELRRMGGEAKQLSIGNSRNQRVWTLSETYLNAIDTKDPELPEGEF